MIAKTIRIIIVPTFNSDNIYELIPATVCLAYRHLAEVSLALNWQDPISTVTIFIRNQTNLQGQHLCERIAILMIFIWLERPRAGDLECERVSGQWPPAAAVEAAKVYR
jgi:hypothetical protein